MGISAAHQAAREAAAAPAALAASKALLDENSQLAKIEIRTGTKPATPEDAASGTLLCTITLGEEPASIEDDALVLETPIEGLVTGAGPSGSDAGWARIYDGKGNAFWDASISATGGAGELQLDNLTLFNGSFCRIASAEFS